MMHQKSKEGAKPGGLVYVVVYMDDRRKTAAAFTDRDRADEFCLSRSSQSAEADCSMVETVVDGITGPTRD